MNITLWVVQVLLALAFLAHGLMFLLPPPEIAAQMNATLPRWFQLFLGVAEVLAAVGLTLPGLTRILPGLVDGSRGGRDDRYGLSDDPAPGARRAELGGDHVRAAADGGLRGPWPMAAPAHCAARQPRPDVPD